MTQEHFWRIPSIDEQRAKLGKRYLEFLRSPAMSAGVYVLAAGSTDPQSPHHEDELYYVVRGRGRMRVGSENQSVEAGSVIFVEKEIEHRFYDVAEELLVLVFFAPAETAWR